MRIHRLEICAFGPFAGTEEIDFDRLSGHGPVSYTHLTLPTNREV